MEPWRNLIFMLRGHTLAFCPQLTFFFTALLLPAFETVHSDAEGGPLNILQLLVNMLAVLKFVRLFGRQYVLIWSHSRPHQQTVAQYVGVDMHHPCMRLNPVVHVDVKSCAAALCLSCFHPKLPAKLAVCPYP